MTHTSLTIIMDKLAKKASKSPNPFSSNETTPPPLLLSFLIARTSICMSKEKAPKKEGEKRNPHQLSQLAKTNSLLCVDPKNWHPRRSLHSPLPIPESRTRSIKRALKVHDSIARITWAKITAKELRKTKRRSAIDKEPDLGLEPDRSMEAEATTPDPDPDPKLKYQGGNK